MRIQPPATRPHTSVEDREEDRVTVACFTFKPRPDTIPAYLKIIPKTKVLHESARGPGPGGSTVWSAIQTYGLAKHPSFKSVPSEEQIMISFLR
jgi:hypothetical protein